MDIVKVDVENSVRVWQTLSAFAASHVVDAMLEEPGSLWDWVGGRVRYGVTSYLMIHIRLRSIWIRRASPSVYS